MISPNPTQVCGVSSHVRALIIAIAISWSTAEAGPYCYNEVGLAPYDGAELPVSPTIAFAMHDQLYGGYRWKRAELPKLTATIDGKPVAISWDDNPIPDGVLRYIKIRSTATGKLELWRTFPYGDGKPSVQATYTIKKDWEPAAPVLSASGRKDNNLGPYYWIEDYLGLDVSVPAISYAIKWRTPGGAWHSLLLPVHTSDHKTEGRIGEQLCGMTENVPIKTLATGIELELRVLLPSGRLLPVIDTPTPVQFRPFDPIPKPNRHTGPPPPSG